MSAARSMSASTNSRFRSRLRGAQRQRVLGSVCTAISRAVQRRAVATAMDRWRARSGGVWQLAKVLSEMGRDDGATRVRIAKEIAQRRLGHESIAQRAWSLMLEYTIGFGYQPLRRQYVMLCPVLQTYEYVLLPLNSIFSMKTNPLAPNCSKNLTPTGVRPIICRSARFIFSTIRC